MSDISKTCIHHGLLKPKDIYVRKNRPPDCRICKNSYQARVRILLDHEKLTERKCSRCQMMKSKNEFQSYDFKLRYPYCSICRKQNSTNEYLKYNSHLKRYGLTMNIYNEMLKEQNHVCAICKNPETTKSGRKDNKSIRKLSVDHNHTTGNVRQLVCHGCNVAIGATKESPETLRQIANYLECHK